MANHDTKPMFKAVTYRIRRLPPTVSKKHLPSFLEDNIEGGVGGADNVYVKSLCPSFHDWNVPAKQTATIHFRTIPASFASQTENEWQASLLKHEDDILIDTHFLGFTPLSSVDDASHAFDCLAVSGLSSHPFGSWRQHASTQANQFMWIRDQLPADFPGMRTITYGYDTSLFGNQSSQTIEDLARTFIADLKTIGRAEISTKPLIILAHSLGGVLIKRTLYYLASSGECERFMLSKIILVVFFGVPNRGMAIDHLYAMVKGQPNDVLVHSLSIGNPYLSLLDDVVYGTSEFQKLRLLSVYETKQSRVAELLPDGSWKRTGQPRLLVSRESAIAKGSRDPEDVFHTDQDHSDMVKFTPDCQAYFTLRSLIAETIKPEASISNVPIIASNDQRQRLEHRAYPYQSNMLTGAKDDDTGLTNAARKYSVPPISSKTIRDLEKSLGFDDIDYRYTSIEAADSTTCDWVFNSQISLLDWIYNGNRMYWIRGKPGSGKSTLMKYLHRNDKFQRAISAYDFATPQIDLWFFFNERGSYLQNSLEGLLRSLLLALVRKDEIFAALVAEVYLSQPMDEHSRWPLDMLRRAFNSLLDQRHKDVQLLLFLDALDEYNGFPEEISRWITHLVNSSQRKGRRTKIKICFSSRPWDTFVKVFHKEPSFTVHDHTLDAIEHYARFRLTSSCRDNPTTVIARLMSDTANGVDIVVHMIARRAEGVFLWVKFAIDELTIFSKVKSIDDLQPVIDSLPDQVQKFYERTIARVSHGDRYKVFVLLELMLRAIGLVTVDNLMLAADVARGETYQQCQTLLLCSEEQLTELPETSGKLINLCGGLLELGQIPDVTEVDKGFATENRRYIQFIHRTVKDFLSKPGFAQLILGPEQATITSNGYTFWMKYLAVTVLKLDDKCLRWYAYKDEASNGRPADVFLDSIPNERFPPRLPAETFSPQLHDRRLEFGILSDLRLYLDKEPRQHPTIKVKLQAPLHIVALDASQQTNYLYEQPNPLHLNLADMTNKLLGLGYSCNEELCGLTPFETLFIQNQANWIIPQTWMKNVLVGIAQQFITCGGQDPDTLIGYGRLPASTDHRIVLRKEWPRQSVLHAAPLPMVKMLLAHGANPNTLDSSSRTPLDKYLNYHVNNYGPGLPKHNYHNVVDIMLLLIKHGAKFTQHSRKVLPKVLNDLADSDGYQDLRTALASISPQEDVTTNRIPRLFNKFKHVISGSSKGGSSKNWRLQQQQRA